MVDFGETKLCRAAVGANLDKQAGGHPLARQYSEQAREIFGSVRLGIKELIGSIRRCF